MALPFNLAKLKKVAEDKTSATFAHQDGHSVKIAIGSLSPAMREQLAKLPLHKAEGGAASSSNQGAALKEGYGEDTQKCPTCNQAPCVCSVQKFANAGEVSATPQDDSSDDNSPLSRQDLMDALSKNSTQAQQPAINIYTGQAQPGGASAGNPATVPALGNPANTPQPEMPPQPVASAPGTSGPNENIAKERAYVENRDMPKRPGNLAPGDMPTDAQKPFNESKSVTPKPVHTEGQDYTANPPTASTPRPETAPAASAPPEEPTTPEIPATSAVPTAAGPGPQSGFAAAAPPPPSGANMVDAGTPQEAHDNTMAYLASEQGKWQQDLANQHITPETYGDLFNQKDTIGKVGMILGLALGSAGAGLSRQPNLLMGMMDKQIDNDYKSKVQSKTNAQRNIELHTQDLLNQANIAEKQQMGYLSKAQADAANVDAQTKSYALQQAHKRSVMVDSFAKHVQAMPDGPPGSPLATAKAQKQATLGMMYDVVNNANFSTFALTAAASARANALLGPTGGATSQQGDQPQAPTIDSAAKELQRRLTNGQLYSGKPEGMAGSDMVTKDQYDKGMAELSSLDNNNKNARSVLNAFSTVASGQTLANRAGHPLTSGADLESVWNNAAGKFIHENDGRVSTITTSMLDPSKPRLVDGPKDYAQKWAGLVSSMDTERNAPVMKGLNIPMPDKIKDWAGSNPYQQGNKPAGGTAPQSVQIQTPSGAMKMVPASQLPQALAAGAKRI